MTSSEHPCFFGTTSKVEITSAKCYVIFGNSTPAHEYSKRPAKIRVERISKDASLSSGVNLYLSIEDLVLPNTETIHMEAAFYLWNNNN